MELIMEKLDNSSLLFLADLLDCILDDIDITLNSTNDSEFIRVLELSRSRLSSTYTLLSNYIIRKGKK